jgi:hypothetical protein
MALKIRRGPNSDRLTYTPSQGELIFTTDTKLVYVGDGTTTGGIAISSGAFTLVNDTSPTLGANLNLNSKNIIGTGNINITGNISGTNLTLSGNLITSSSLTGPATNLEVVIGPAAPSSGSSSHTLTINAMGSNPPLRLKTLTGGLGNISRALFQGVGGTYANPTLPTLGDYIGGLNFSSSNGTSLIPTASILARSDPNGTMSSTLADGKLEFITAGHSGASFTFNTLSFDSFGRLAVNQSSAQTTLDVNGTFRFNSLTPASSSAPGVTGQHAWDSNYMYVCTATNTWKRAALTSF